MQFVACKFRPEDARTYTYAWDGEPFAVGDEVMVADSRGGLDKRVIVDSVTDEAPPYACKPILWKAPPKSEAAPIAEDFTADINPEDLF